MSRYSGARSEWCLLVLSVLMLAVPVFALPQNSGGQSQNSSARHGSNAQQRLAEEVRHQLVLLPFYTVFDNLQYSVMGDQVTLSGQVRIPTIKIDAVNAVKGIEGVGKVIDNIEVLPVSPMDDQIRRAEYRAIYGFPSLEKYSYGTIAQIHIIVKNGHVTLVGTVDNQSDKDTAEIRAKSVPNVFSVTNDLQVVPAT